MEQTECALAKKKLQTIIAVQFLVFQLTFVIVNFFIVNCFYASSSFRFPNIKNDCFR